jgi:quercetin dioxygenase-like cupin family protein
MAQSQITDPNSNPLGDYADRDYESKQTVKTKGWQVASVDDNAMWPSPTGRNFIMLSKEKDSRVVINCYDPGASDEMHCHPGSEHTFLVWKGQLHLTGIEDGEDVTLGPGQFVQIAAGYYYRLHNPGTEPAVYCQFGTVPANQPKRTTVLFEESRRGKQAAAES